jgi:sugar lactone lactonase YvrE
MRLFVVLMVALLVAGGPASGLAGDGDGSGKTIALEEAASNSRQWTGVAVSRQGRVFVNFPRWSADVPVSVGELNEDGSVVPYPDESYNGWQAGDESGERFVCVQSVYVDRLNRLWILDPASAWLRGVVPPGAKLLQVNLKTNKVERSYIFDETVAPRSSYLNDVRVDTGTETAFITDSGMGALVVVDLETGKARRVLEDHPSVKAEKTVVKIGEQPVPFTVHSDGIALDPEGGWLYYQALTGRTMYRIATSRLVDANVTGDELAGAVEKFADSGVSDGLLWTREGIYVSAIEQSAIRLVGPDGSVSTLVQDDRLAWPDSFARGADGTVWVTTSQIHLGPNPPEPYRIFRLERGSK